MYNLLIPKIFNLQGGTKIKMERECIYKDFYDVDQRYREEKMKNLIERNFTQNEFLTADVKAALSEMKAEIKAVNNKITQFAFIIMLTVIAVGAVLSVLIIKTL